MVDKPQLSFWERLLRIRHWRLTLKLSLVMLIISLIPLLLATAISTNTSSDALAQQAELSAEALTQQTGRASEMLTQQTRINIARLAYSTAQRIEQFLIDNLLFIKMASNDMRVIRFLSAQTPAAQQAEFDGVLRLINNVIESSLPPNGDITTIDLMGITDSTGIFQIHNLVSSIGRDFSDREFFKVPVEEGVPYTETIKIGRTTGVPGINVGSPVWNETGDIIGVVVTRIRPEYISTILESTLEIESTDIRLEDREAIDIYLLNEYRLIMSHTDSDSPWLFRSLGNPTQEELDTIINESVLGGVCPDGSLTCGNDVERITREPLPISTMQEVGETLDAAMSTGESGALRYCRPSDLDASAIEGDCANGDWHVMGFAPVYDPYTAAEEDAQALFMVVVDLPEQLFLAAIEEQRAEGQLIVQRQRNQGEEAVEEQRTLGGIIAAVMGAIAVFTSILVARTVARPIGKLANAATRIERNEAFEPVEIADLNAQGDEIGNLSRVFSAMVMALRARMAELETIYEIGTNITSSVDLTPTLFYIVEALSRVIPFQAAEVSLYDKDSNKMVMHVQSGMDATGQTTVSRREYSLHEGLLGVLTSSDNGVLINDVASANIELENRGWNSLPPRAYMGVPLKVKNELIGAIELVSTSPQGFSEDNLRVLQTIVIQAAVAVQNAREVQSRERKLKQEIRKLQIEVDQARKNQQVQEITETDYFQELAQRARNMRRGRSSEADESGTSADAEE